MRLRKVVFAKMLALALVGTARGDQWTFFYPAEVTQLSCSVQDVVEYPSNQEVFQASAHAKRSPEPDWTMTVGQFPIDRKHPEKSRHEAEKACSKWMDQAGQRVRKAHEPR